MYKILRGMMVFFVFLLIGSGLASCEIQDDDNLVLNELDLYELDLYELVVLPGKPDCGDQICIIEKICGTESDVILSFQGNHIEYKRYFNSLMGMPCAPRLDTTFIGQLNKGSYQIVQNIIDKNHFISDSIFLQDSISVLVSE